MGVDSENDELSDETNDDEDPGWPLNIDLRETIARCANAALNTARGSKEVVERIVKRVRGSLGN